MKGAGLMKRKVKSILLMMISAFILICAPLYNAVNGTYYDRGIYADGMGSFYILTGDSDSFVLEGYDKNGMNMSRVSEGIQAQEVLFCGKDLYLICPFGDSASIYRPFAVNDQMFIAEGVYPQKGCTVVSGGKVYIKDSREDKTIRVYDSFREGYDEIKAPQSIKALFLTEDNRVRAVLSDGVLCAESGRHIVCDTPELPYSRNDGIFCGNGGGVFSYNDSTGFKKLLTVNGGTVYTHGCLYTLRDGSIYRLDMNGNVTGEYGNALQNAERLVSSGETLAAVCGGDLVYIGRKDFKERDDDTEKSSVSKPTESREPEQQSRTESTPKESHEDNRQSSAEIRRQIAEDEQHSSEDEQQVYANVLQNSDDEHKEKFIIPQDGIINVPDGTTVAALKKKLVGYETSFRDYRGRTMTSGKIGTGANVELYSEGELAGTCVIVVKGDVTGEGNINTSDIIGLSKYLVHEEDFDEAELTASDMNNDGMNDIRDLYLMHKHFYRDE